MTKSSSHRRERRLRNRQAVKPRTEYVVATTATDISRISLIYNHDSGEIEFETPLTEAHFSASYSRPKGEKSIHKVPIAGQNLQIDSTDALIRNFDLFAAIDTNTKVIREQFVSVTGVVLGEKVLQADGGLAIAWRTPFVIEMLDATGEIEKLGWVEGLRALKKYRFIGDHQRLGVIVDAYLNELSAINSGSRELIKDVNLPRNMKLIYASADVGSEYLANTLIRAADKAASMTLKLYEAKGIPESSSDIRGVYFKRSRVLFGKGS